ncbi:MAG: TIGR03960 family B12-binding radical SAM protein [Planctomycetes bacterium]|nr:TIGR03960 family B12-binding radical SAM protein [Planctomycetota bacterium]
MAKPAPFSEEEYQALLPQVRMPGRYIGGEVNQVRKDPDQVALRWALLYPDAYEVGMAHLGLKILYHTLNQVPGLWAERCFAPWPDFEAALRRRGWPLTTLESRAPLRELDVLGFTLQSELTYTNLLTCLDLGGVPLRAADRGLGDPLVVAGGAGTLNPEPLADFVDLFLLGDGEEAVVEFSRVLIEERGRHPDRPSLIRALVERCPWLYWPAQWQPEYDGPALAATVPLDGARTPRRAVVYDLENAPFPTAPVVPFLRTIHDRITIEIMRGCVQGCRFCQAGMEKRPQRFRSAAKVLELARESYRNTGLNEVGLTSLSSSDHPDLIGILDALIPVLRPEQVRISMPSLRVDQQVGELAERLAEVRGQGLTLAPEVATDRLRRIVNKGIADQDLYRGAERAWRSGFTGIKLYFMIGIPGEEEADVDGIVRMSERCSQIRQEVLRGGPGKVTASASTFVPKPLTPFQWAAQARPQEIAAKQARLRRLVKLRSVAVKCHPQPGSLIEGFLSRADRRAGAVIETAWRLGARFDAWTEQETLEHWERAWEDHGYGPEQSAFRQRPLDEPLPWDHLDPGVTREYLRADYEKSQGDQFTDHCQTESCGDCGVGAKTCVDIKALTGMFERFDQPKLKARAAASPLLQSAPGRAVVEPELEERSRRRLSAAGGPSPASR